MPKVGSCLKCGSCGLNDCKHKRIPLTDVWEGIHPMYFFILSAQEEKKRNKHMKHFHIHIQGGLHARWEASPPSILRSHSGTVSRDSYLQITEPFLTTLSKKESKRTLGCSLALCKGQRFMFLSSLLALIVIFSSAVNVLWCYQIFFKRIWIINYDTYFN